MKSALIGYSGFVGGNLRQQASFDDLYNSQNIQDIAGKHYELLVCAGAPAKKWLANRDPAGDRQALDRLQGPLNQVHADRVILISTVDVLPRPIEVDEDAPIAVEALQPYGLHRYQLERFVADRFRTHVIRLPGLFGAGLKKNIIFDFLHHNAIDQVHADAVFQFYDLSHLWSDIQRVMGHAWPIVHFATAPLSVKEVAQEGFGFPFENRPAGAPPRYDFRSRYAQAFGGKDGYLYGRDQVLADLRRFIVEERSRLRETRSVEPRLAS